jgi:hypothetical protein
MTLNEVTGRCHNSEFNPLDARHRRHHLYLTAGLSRVTDYCVLSLSADTEGVDVSVCCEKGGGAVKVIMYRVILKFPQNRPADGHWPACSFRSAQAATLLEFHVPLTNCFVRRWFCVVHGPKPPLHRHN